MKADPADQRALLDLAEVDAGVSRATHRRSHSPEAARVAELVEALREYRDQTVAAQIAAEDLAREVRRLENDIAVLDTRLSKDSALLNGGTLTGKALTEIEHEIAGLHRRRGVAEDELLEVMERQEATAAEELRCGALVTHTEEEIEKADADAATAMSEIDVTADAARARRDELRGQIDDALLAVYDKQVAQGRIGAGLLRQARCGACRMEIDRGTLSRYGQAPADEVLRCDECGAIIVRTHESGV
ncbi:zinc ribbon domain-containing protein [Williamsia sp. M5A3_1d]